MTDSPAARGARAAARRLAAAHGPRLEADVEAALHARGPAQYADPASLGSLIVSAAALAWTVYQDLRARTERPARAVVTRRVRLELPADGRTSGDERDGIIAVVVDEVVTDAEE
ncbi:hypothetical protein BLA24_02175 [Streptomyces cinnamoneus]|uniref:Uncharacterized protein n=1 Tax=Streptomyces cinnamoneus TaxID=53446 RepID=A0A2G1XQ42_STRCJ|nr:hypothetical protein BLA24_02175 [Streptomyces cinnamoneus]PPT16348.1 hypothetical protein CYQ11_04540 [Streptomyces cinnamoneus]